jgi:glycerol-3-phosphate acyltransferase PlsX
LGLSGPVIKAHGSSDEKAFYNAIRQARLFVENGVIQRIEEELSH